MAIADFLKGAPTMPKNDTNTGLATAVAAIDFDETNAEIDRLETERRTANAKADEAQAEAQRLAEQIRVWTGPDPEALADAVLSGGSAAEVAAAAPTRELLVERRDVLLATAAALRDRAERARRAGDDVRALQRQALYDACAGFLSEQAKIQTKASQELLAAIAAADAVRELAGFNYADAATSKARRGVTGAASILGQVDRIRVPDDVIAALKPVEARAKGLRPVPVTVPNN